MSHKTALAGATAALWISTVRTIVPMIVGWVLGLAVTLNITLDKDFETALTGFITVAFSVLYYVIGRLLELYVNPKLGWLLGNPKSPDSYS